MININSISHKIRNFIIDNYNTSEYFIYGSFVEYKYGFIIEPKDIDITVACYNLSSRKYFSVDLDGVDLPLEITLMSKSDIYEEAKSLEPKYLLIDYPVSGYTLTSEIEHILDEITTGEIRSSISSISSKAFHKGKKKLTVQEDYDEYLGLKNLYHAFKFIILAMRRMSPIPISDVQFLKSKDIMDLYNIRRLIWDTYNNSTGTLEERWKVLDAEIKPLYNAYMTQFRKVFPKEIK